MSWKQVSEVSVALRAAVEELRATVDAVREDNGAGDPAHGGARCQRSVAAKHEAKLPPVVEQLPEVLEAERSWVEARPLGRMCPFSAAGGRCRRVKQDQHQSV